MIDQEWVKDTINRWSQVDIARRCELGEIVRGQKLQFLTVVLPIFPVCNSQASTTTTITLAKQSRLKKKIEHFNQHTWAAEHANDGVASGIDRIEKKERKKGHFSHPAFIPAQQHSFFLTLKQARFRGPGQRSCARPVPADEGCAS